MEGIKELRKNSFEKRRTMSAKMLDTYPDCIPVIIDRYSKTDPEIKKHKYLCNGTDEIGLLLVIIRKNMMIPLSSGNALFVYSEKSKMLISPQNVVGDLHNKYADKDNFLYLYYSVENTFGSEPHKS